MAIPPHGATSRDKFIMPHLQIPDESPDIIVRSSDGVDFHVHSRVLSMMSTGLLPKSVSKDSTESARAIDIPEDSRTLSKLFQLCYPIRSPRLESIHITQAVLVAARRYRMVRAIEVAEKEWARFLREDHLRAYFIAMKHTWMEDAKEAAKYAACHTVDTYVPEMDGVPAEAYRRLFDYRKRCQDTFTNMVAPYNSFQDHHPLNGIRSFAPFWSDVFSEMMNRALSGGPNSSSILAPLEVRYHGYSKSRPPVETLVVESKALENDLHAALSKIIIALYGKLRLETHHEPGFGEALHAAIPLVDWLAKPVSQRVTYCGFLIFFHTRGLLVPNHRLTIYTQRRLFPNLFYHHDMAPASSPFDRADADIIIRSSDGVDFRVHKTTLAMSSPLFDGMFNVPQPATLADEDTHPESGLPLLRFTEDHQTLDSLLRLCYPLVIPVLEDLGDVSAVLEAAKKYHIDCAIARMGERLLAFVPKEPLRVYAIACCVGLKAEAEFAAKATPDTIPLDLESFNQLGFNRITSGQLFHLMDFLRRRRDNRAAEFVIPTATPLNSTTSRDTFVKPHLQIPDKSPDIIIRSSDGIDFHVHSHVLSVISTGLLPASLDKDSTEDARTIDVPEDSQILSPLLQLCYPMRSPRLESLDATQAVLEAARRYQIVRAVEVAEKEWTKFLPEDHLRAYFIAMKHGWMDEAEEAAKYAACYTVDTYIPEMDRVPAEAYRRLFDYRRRCQDTFINVAQQHNCDHHDYSWFNGLREYAPFWSDVISGMMNKALNGGPNSSSILVPVGARYRGGYSWEVERLVAESKSLEDSLREALFEISW
ncbi:hypothetical protein A0H81_05180 [Grifola frondosa]|uniref:BTB domain-containing protein n=1 Tax=Grifola frondosa TaxID=5627 RepID=A0A1C7MDB0_GRIFR|nr:hypothetical protein A0H81_05180 [Grifola frondosa]